MKKISINYFFAGALLLLGVAGCKDEDFENGKIQSVDNQGHDQNMISTAVTATSNSEFIAYSVDASTTESEIQLIPVVLTAKGTASQDIHVKFVPALDSLESYNVANKTAYIMPGGEGTPAFTLLDDGVATIPKGSSVGYLKIKTVTNDYFGDDQYAFAYKIESVQESGYSISGNHNFGIAAVIPKNDYDGLYLYGPGKIERFTAGTPNTNDPLQGDFDSLDDAPLVTTGKYSLLFKPIWADNSGGVGGIDGTTITIDPVAQADGTHLVTMSSKSNPSLMNMPGQVNKYDPKTKTFLLAFTWGTANKRNLWTKLTFKEPR
ncbi:MAG TPA: DUF1735 domain-containing protein [Ohtaekwangia sp.]|uniref:DUF1735 domain-containing protein n=1 Tax=Ohtaekwangia sp. TaxID=2066019 RepID=UPI002F941AAC